MKKIKFKQGTAKIGSKQDYTNTAKSLTKEEKAEFAKLDASGKAFEFKGFQYAGKDNFEKAKRNKKLGGIPLKEITVTAPAKNKLTNTNNIQVPNIIKTNLKSSTKPSNNSPKEEKRSGYLDRVLKDNVFMKKGNDPRAERDAKKITFQIPNEGVGDYLSTLFTVPQKELNYLLTRKYEEPATTWNRDKSKENQLKGTAKFIADVVTDPMIYETPGVLIEKGAVMTGKAVGKYAPIAAKKTLQAGKYIGKKGKEAAQLAYNYAKKFPLDKIAENVWKFKTKIAQAAVHTKDEEDASKYKKGSKRIKFK